MVMRVSKLHVNPKQKTNLAAIAARCLPLHVYSKRDPVGREITVFPAQAQTYTKNDDTSDLDAGVGESVGFMECSGSGAE